LWPSLILLLISLLVLGFWSLQFADQRLVKRTISLANINDFSWRNRVVSWAGALQMIADNPWFGFGWNQPGVIYNELYRPTKLVEGLSIFLNDYLMVGMILGLPALTCLLLFIYSKFFSGHRGFLVSDMSIFGLAWEKTIFRAAFLVLLIAFFPEHGLFYVASGIPFWILIALGSSDCDNNINRHSSSTELKSDTILNA
jgi:O-antigen ligase